MQTTKEYNLAASTMADQWVPANGGNEEPFTKDGTRWLYVWNPYRAQHGYLNLDTDIVETSLPE